jgi:hypothetical protein
MERMAEMERHCNPGAALPLGMPLQRRGLPAGGGVAPPHLHATAPHGQQR